MEDRIATEQRIKDAARQVFMQKGYHGTKIRDIAEAAGINLALVNYYFRSKEQLFELIYQETFITFLGVLAKVLNEPTPLEVKIWKIAEHYTDFVKANPLIPMFILSEHREGIAKLFEQRQARQTLEGSLFWKQLHEEIQAGRIRPITPVHLVSSIVGGILFPLLAQPMIMYMSGGMKPEEFSTFMDERRHLVPEMVMAYLRKV